MPGFETAPPAPATARSEDDPTLRARLEQLVRVLATELPGADSARLDTWLGDALQSVGEAIEVEHAYLFRRLGPSPRLVLTHEWCDESGRPSLTDPGELMADVLQGATRSQPHAPIVLDGSALRRCGDLTHPLLVALGARSLVAVPLVSGASTLGVVGFATERCEHAFSPDLLALLRFVGDLFVQAIERHEPGTGLDDRAVERDALIDRTPDLVMSVAADGEILEANRDVWQVPRSEAVGRNSIELLGRDERDRYGRALYRAFEESRADGFEHRAPDGSWLYTRVIPLDREGRVTQAVVVCTDLTQRKQAEELLRLEGEVLERIALGTPVQAILDRLCALVERQVDGSSCIAILERGDGAGLEVAAAAGLEEGLRRALTSGGSEGLAGALGTLAGTDGSAILDEIAVDPRASALRARLAELGVFACWSAPVLLEGALPAGVFAILLRERRRPNEHQARLLQAASHLAGIALQRTRAEERLRLTQFSVERSSIAVFWLDRQGRFTFVNEEACRMLGYRREQLLAMRLGDVDPTATVERFAQQWSTIRLEKRVHFETRHRTRDGLFLPIEMSVNYLEFGGQEYVCAFARDVSKRRRAETTLRESEERFSRAFRSSPLPMLICRLEDGRLIDVNDEFARLAGWPRERCIGSTTEELSLWSDATEHRRLVEILRDAGSVRGWECECRSRDGARRHVALWGEALDLGGERCVLATLQDVTDRETAEAERERLESLLRQSQKMEALGQLAGGVAHDFNNVLTAILGNSEILLHHVRRDEETPTRAAQEAALLQIQRAGERGAALVRHLLAFSRKQVRRLELLDPARLVAEMQPMLRRLIGEHIALETRDDAGGAAIRADATQFEQLILNLALNARDAMPHGGRLAIEIALVEPGSDPGLPCDETPTSAFLRLRVTDSGCGIPAENLPRIFEPFYTTKPPGQGTGLGLATVYGIVKQSGGHVHVASRPGDGSTFTVYLPSVPGPAPPPREEDPAVEAEHGRETVLVCEDEEMVRGLACEILVSRGYQVLSAANGREALQVVEGHSGAIDLLVTDTVMPEMNGLELAEALGQRHPGLRVLFVSGYAPDVLGPHGLEEGRLELLPKPFSASALLRRVRRALDH